MSTGCMPEYPHEDRYDAIYDAMSEPERTQSALNAHRAWSREYREQLEEIAMYLRRLRKVTEIDTTCPEQMVCWGHLMESISDIPELPF